MSNNNDGAEVSYSVDEESWLMANMDRDGGGKGKKGTKGGSPGGTAGYSTMTEGDITDADRAKAQSLMNNEHLLSQKLQDKIFIDACFLRGVEPQQLKALSYESFATEPNRARRLSAEEQKLRYDTYENGRLHLMTLVVSQETKSRAKAKEAEVRNAQRFNKLATTFQKQLEREQQILARMNQSRAKYEKVLEVENTGIKTTLVESEHKEESDKYRHTKIQDMKHKIQEQLRERSAVRKEQIAQRVESRKQEEDNWRAMQKMKLEAKEKQIERHLSGQTGSTEEVRVVPAPACAPMPMCARACVCVGAWRADVCVGRSL
jgi:hypothetical protein